MATRQVGLSDVQQGGRPSRLKLLAPLRYLAIKNPEKAFYDFTLPLVFAVAATLLYFFVVPKLPIFGDDGLLRFARDLLIMALPFMVGALAAVAMGSPGSHLDRRLVGVELFLGDRRLTLRQFVCYLLGYLCFLGFMTLGAAVMAQLLHKIVVSWLNAAPQLKLLVKIAGISILFQLFSALSVTVLWSLYFLTDIVNRGAAD
jgi:hypothetical protein